MLILFSIKVRKNVSNFTLSISTCMFQVSDSGKSQINNAWCSVLKGKADGKQFLLKVKLVFLVTRLSTCIKVKSRRNREH